MIHAIPNPSKKFQVEKSVADVKASIKALPMFSTKYQIHQSNEVISQYVFEASEFLSLGVYIDVECFAVSDSRTDVSLTVRRKIGSFDKSHEVSLANQHLATMTELISQSIGLGEDGRARLIEQRRQQAAAQAYAPKKKTSVTAYLVIGGVALLALIGYISNKEDENKGGVTVAGMEFQTIPGVSASDVTLPFEAMGFETSKHQGSDVFTNDSRGNEKGIDYVVSVSGKTESQVLFVRGSATYKEKSKSDKAVAAFLSKVAETPYRGAEPSVAKDWALRHAKSGGDTTIGGMKFEVVARTAGVRMLNINP